jgi:hypothetical protein
VLTIAGLGSLLTAVFYVAAATALQRRGRALLLRRREHLVSSYVLSRPLDPSSPTESAAAMGGETRWRSDAREIGSHPKWVMRHCSGAGNIGKELLLGGRPWLLATVFPTVVLRSGERGEDDEQ